MTALCKALIYQSGLDENLEHTLKRILCQLPQEVQNNGERKGKEKSDNEIDSSLSEMDNAHQVLKGATLLMEEGLTQLEEVGKMRSKFVVHKEESVHPYPNSANYDRSIHLKSVSSVVILFDPQCKTVSVQTHLNQLWLSFQSWQVIH